MLLHYQKPQEHSDPGRRRSTRRGLEFGSPYAHEIGDRFRCDFRDVEGRRCQRSPSQTTLRNANTGNAYQASVQQRSEDGSRRWLPACPLLWWEHGPAHLPHVAREATRESLPTRVQRREAFTLPSPTGMGSVTTQDGFVRLGETQPMHTQPTAKPIGHAHVPPDSLWWILLLVKGLGSDRRQALPTVPIAIG